MMEIKEKALILLMFTHVLMFVTVTFTSYVAPVNNGTQQQVIEVAGAIA